MRQAIAAALLLVNLLLNDACSTAPTKPALIGETVNAPADQSQHFPALGLTRQVLTPNHLLGKAFMPGGNIADYRSGRLVYQEFLAKLPDNETAALLLLDWKKALQQPHYLAHMGGYFGRDGAQSVYVFAKGPWIAGVIGLPEETADPIARSLAARI